MIPGDKKKFTTAYLSSLAATTTPARFTEAALPLLRRDSLESFMNQVYPTAILAANEAQKAYLEAEIKRQKVRIKTEH